MGRSARKTRKLKTSARAQGKVFDPSGAMVKNGSAFPSSRRRSARPHNFRPWIKNGDDAMREWQECQRFAALRALESSAIPTLEMDQANPWWAIVEDSRGRLGDPIVLMGLPAKGAPAPDWPAMAQLACDKLMREKSGVSMLMRRIAGDDVCMQASAKPLKSLIEPDSDPSQWAGCERASLWRITALTGFPRRLSSARKAIRSKMAEQGHFDPRRSRRRKGILAPHCWIEKFGRVGQAIWSLGAASRRLLAEPNTAQRERLDAVIEAMGRSGALSVRLCPDFHIHNPQAFANWASFVEMDAARLDPIRSKWAIEDGAQTPDLPRSARPRI